MKKSYNVNGCEEPEHNDVYDYKETTGNGSIWWRSRKYNKMLRFTPGWGWSLGWYTHTDCDSEIPPSTGWTFNGGRCNPPELGRNIIIKGV